MSGLFYFVYIMTNKWHTVLYTGVTNDVIRRGGEHREKLSRKSFTARYNCSILVYYEVFDNPADAIAREKQIRSWSRGKKIRLIESMNPTWRDILPELESRGWPL